MPAWFPAFASERPMRLRQRWPVWAAVTMFMVYALYWASPLTFGDSAAGVDIPAALLEYNDGGEFAWTFGEPEGLPLVLLGTPYATVNMSDADIVVLKSGQTLLEEVELSPLEATISGHLFNLAVIKLPRGSEWGFVGVARGPTRRREFMQIKGRPSYEQSMAAFGLNMDKEGRLTPTSKAYLLDYQQIPRPACEMHGPWIASYGPEDPRLFWTDAGTPAMTFGRSSDLVDLCRIIGLVPDLRAWFPQLDDALKSSKQQGAANYASTHKAGQPAALELMRKDLHSKLEKNWAAFYAGGSPDPEVLYPHINYAIAPVLPLVVDEAGLRRITYEPVHMPEEQAKCLHQLHHNWSAGAMHQATPFYRLTMCERGCRATDENTVNWAVFHAKLGSKVGGPRYLKFFATFNVSAPFNPISAGPAFSITGTNDADEHPDISFVLTLAPLEAADFDPSLPSVRTPGKYLPSHFFLDDHVLVTLGHRDSAMISSVLTVKQALARHKLCRDVEY